MRRVMTIVFAAVVLYGTAQESQPMKLQFDQSKISSLFTSPELPMTVLPSTGIKPTFNTTIPTAAELDLGDHMSNLTDSLAIYQQATRANYRPVLPRFTYDTNPYSRDWSSSGVITTLGGGYLTGAGSHTTYPGLGNTATASVAFTMPMGDRFQATVGLTGSKYHFDRGAWNDYGVFGNASFKINDRFSLNAFGQYYVNQRFHTIAAMPFMGSSSYGGTLDWHASDNFSLGMGVRRLYDPYTGTWRTLPVVQPTFTLLGAPISFDAGPLIYQLLGNLFGNSKNTQDWGDPKYRPVMAPNAVTGQPGFNSNSPVPIPDVFRH